MFSRLVKETLDLMKTLKEETDSQQQSVTNETILPALLVGQEECQSIQSSMMSILEKSWVWLAGVLDVVEGQLRMGKHFDTKVGLSLSRTLEPKNQKINYNLHCCTRVGLFKGHTIPSITIIKNETIHTF